MRTFNAADGSAGTAGRIVAFRAPAGRVGVSGGSMLDASGWRGQTHALVAVNGGFFDPAGLPVGLVIAGGRRLSRLRKGGGGVFIVENTGASIVSAAILRHHPARLRTIREALQCGPVLVEHGKPNRLKVQFARRTGIGIQHDGLVVIAVADGDFSLRDWGALWADPRGLNCVDALNLDGGPSSQLSLAASRTLELPGGWPVPDAVVMR